MGENHRASFVKTLALVQNTLEQLVLLMHPNFRLRFATSQIFSRKLSLQVAPGYFCRGAGISHKIGPWAFVSQNLFRQIPT